MRAIIAAAILAIAAPALAAQDTVESCKAHIDKQLAKIDKEMKRGYREPRGNQLREMRRTLTRIRHECNSNPAAWRKAP